VQFKELQNNKHNILETKQNNNSRYL